MEGKVLGHQSFALGRPPAVLGEGSVVGKKRAPAPWGIALIWSVPTPGSGRKAGKRPRAPCSAGPFTCLPQGRRILFPNPAAVCRGPFEPVRQLPRLPCGRAPSLTLGCTAPVPPWPRAWLWRPCVWTGGFGSTACAMTSSHFCSAERQFRFPLNYGGSAVPRPSGPSPGQGPSSSGIRGAGGPYVTHVTVGHVVDAGITDAGNMGAAMAPAAFESLSAHFSDTGRTPRGL